MSSAGHGHGDADSGAALAEFRAFRERMNAEILGENNLVINRFFALDGRAYEAGAVDVTTKETMSIGLIVGGSIVIPHLRRAVDRWTELTSQSAAKEEP
jgi:hypothetical protein